MATVNMMHERTDTSSKLAEDFSTWWSGKTWTWKPEILEAKGPSSKAAMLVSTDINSLEDANIQKARADKQLSYTGGDTANLAQLEASILPPKRDLSPAEIISAAEADATSTVQPPLHNVPPFFEIRRSATGGYGAFAIQDIRPFIVVLEEPPLIEASNAEFMEKFENLSPKDQEDFMDLACFEEISRDIRRAIFKTNRFYTTGGSNAVFRIACRFNHSCLPQIDYHWSRTKNVLVMSTKRFIRKGEEIFISYGQGPETLLCHYGFLCNCGSCAPIEPRDLKPESWELEYWQKRTSSEMARDEVADWGTGTVEHVVPATEIVFAKDLENVVREWEVSATADVIPKKANSASSGW